MKIKGNMVVVGDNLEIMRGMDAGSIDLIYADPPFNTGKDWGQFNDKWEGGMKGYLKFMEPRLAEMHRLLKDTGSIYLHCDTHASHYLKVMMDNVFGMKHFRNEIVWCYTMPVSSTQHFPRKHDTIFLYWKTSTGVFNADAIRIPYNPESIARYGRNQGNKGLYGDSYVFIDNGKVPEDWWVDISKLKNQTERNGYPTQKPLKLLERIIRASSNQGDVVLDPFCGSGTTLVAAKTLGRKYIGIDQNPEAVRIAQSRLNPSQQELEPMVAV